MLLELVRDLGRSDATAERTPYAVAVNQFGHAAVGLFTTLILIDLGAGQWLAAGLTAALWGAAWEGLQYVRGRTLGRTVRRRWDWFTDAAAFTTGALAALMAGDVGWAPALALILLMVAGAVVAWSDNGGRTPAGERQTGRKEDDNGQCRD